MHDPRAREQIVHRALLGMDRGEENPGRLDHARRCSFEGRERRRELRRRARLPEEALKREVVIAPGKNDLQRDSAIGRAIVRDIDDAQAAASDLTLRW